MKNIDLIWNTKLSMLHYLKEVLLKKIGYTQSGTKALIGVVKNTSYVITDCDIVYTDTDGNPEESVVVKNGNNVIDTSLYSINYYTKEITFTTSYPRLSVEFSFYTTKVIDAYPEGETIESFLYSIVSFEVGDVNTKDFAIGTSLNFWTMNYFIEVFAINENIRMRIVSGFVEALKKEWISLIDFSEGALLSNDGTLNTGFDTETQRVFYIKDKKEASADFSGTASFEKIKRYLASIRGSLKIIQ